MKKNLKSISTLFTLHQVTMLAVILLFFLAAGTAVVSGELRNARQERSFQLSDAVNAVSTRLNRIESNVFETLTTANGSYDGLWSGESGRKVIDKLKLNQLIVEKQVLNSDLSVFYAFVPDDFMIYQAARTVPFEERLRVKDYLERDLPSEHGNDNRRWQFYEIGGKLYAGIQYYLRQEGFYIGILADPKELLTEIDFLTQIYDGNYQVSDASGITFSSGQAAETSILKSGIRTETLLTPDLRMSVTIPVTNVTAFSRQMFLMVFTALLLGAVVIILNNTRLRKKVIRPVLRLSGELKEIDDVTQMKPVSEDAEVTELRTLESTLNTLLSEAVADRMKLYETEIQKKGQELTLLRSQIRPHFFLNAITTVSAMTYQDRNDDIRNYLMKLSQYIRYVIGTEEDLVTLEQELSNINNYFELQEIRFPHKAMVFIDCEEGISGIRLPKYLLLTIVENSYKYALGQTEFMEVLIQCRKLRDAAFSGVMISIEDNGPGFSEEQLAYYNSEQTLQDADGHIGLKNVRQTLQLHYNDRQLMRVENVLPSGARIEIRIPEEADTEQPGTIVPEGTDRNESTDR